MKQEGERDGTVKEEMMKVKHKVKQKKIVTGTTLQTYFMQQSNKHVDNTQGWRYKSDGHQYMLG